MASDWLKHLARFYLPVYQYESETMKIVYAGYSTIKKNFHVRLILGNSTSNTFLGRMLFWKVKDLIKLRNLDMAVAETSRISLDYFKKCKGFIIPEWAMMKIRIDKDINEICNKDTTDFSNVTRRIRKYGLTYEILTDDDSFKYFIDHVYLPYISKRHGEEALIEDLNSLWKSAPSPVLMAIRENGIIVAESLIRKSGEDLCFMRLGVLDGNEEYMRHGVIGALYYFGILEGQKIGCKYFDVGGTRPFLNDGLTKYKMGLGAEFFPDFNIWKEYLWLGLNENSVNAKNFIVNNPFMHMDDDYKMVKNNQET
jgi:hypothetical protein